MPCYIQRVKFDLVIFHTLFFSSRHDSRSFRFMMDKASPVAQLDAVKVVIPQDEFINAEIVNEFINRFGIDAIFSVQPESEWPRIYRTVDRSRVRIYRVLTGYLDRTRVGKIGRFRNKTGHRSIDLGYRTAGRPPAWFGRHGLMKQRIADVFASRANKVGLKIDISTSGADTLLGDDWYRFLCRCKYTLGVEGGTSILDFDGSIKRKTEEYFARNPQATFEEIEKACFPDMDGHFQGFVISPRHLESCAAKTCQVLIEGHYSGILSPGKHYVEVKRDFSNLDDVLEVIRRDDLRVQITEAAYTDIVESGKHTYENFVDFVIEKSLGASLGSKDGGFFNRLVTTAIHNWMRGMTWIDRLFVIAMVRVVSPLRQRLARR